MSLSRHALFLAAFVLVGCGDGVTRRAVSGNVVVDGQPLNKGLIEFDPLDGQVTRGSATIDEGKYALSSGEGLSDGKYRVRIISTARTDPIPVPPGHVGPPTIPKDWIPKKIPDKYNRASTLEIVVTSGSNTFPFDLDGDLKDDLKLGRRN